MTFCIMVVVGLVIREDRKTGLSRAEDSRQTTPSCGAARPGHHWLPPGRTELCMLGPCKMTLQWG